METTRYLGLKQIGDLFGVSAATVSKWRTRYAESHPCPEPDVWIGDTPGWVASSATTWKGWKELLPGQGRGGGPLPLNAALEEFTRAFNEISKTATAATDRMRMIALAIAAAEYGVDEQTIKAVWLRIAEENPTMPNEEVDPIALATIMRGRKRLELTTGQE